MQREEKKFRAAQCPGCSSGPSFCSLLISHLVNTRLSSIPGQGLKRHESRRPYTAHAAASAVDGVTTHSPTGEQRDRRKRIEYPLSKALRIHSVPGFRFFADRDSLHIYIETSCSPDTSLHTKFTFVMCELYAHSLKEIV